MTAPPAQRSTTSLKPSHLELTLKAGAVLVIGYIFARAFMDAAAFNTTPFNNEAAEVVIDRHQDILHIALFALCWAIVKGRISTIGMALSTLVGKAVNFLGLLDEDLHYWLMGNALFPDSITHQGFVNPQYTKLFIFAILGAILCLQMMRKKTRTIGRFFALMALGAIMLTALVFHKLLPEGLLIKEKQFIQERLAYAAQLPTKERERICQDWSFTCITFTEKEGAAHAIAQAKLNIPHQSSGQFHTGTTGIMQNNRFIIQSYAIYEVSKNGAGVLAIESKQSMRAQRIAEKAFSTLGIIAHGFWILFAWALSSLHNHRVRFKLFAKPQQNQAV